MSALPYTQVPPALATLPGLYPLYVLFTDYPQNNLHRLEKEAQEHLRAIVRRVFPTLPLRPAFRKSLALRLFTGRVGLERYPPYMVDEAWRELREEVMRIYTKCPCCGQPAPHLNHRRVLAEATAQPHPQPHHKGPAAPARTAPQDRRAAPCRVWPKAPFDPKQSV